VRLLLDRYGIVFRELLQRELPPLRWSGLFRALRLMELSGEILSGHFFEGIDGLQFVSPSAWRELQQPPGDAVWWVNAADPASLCGLLPPEAGLALPPRLPGTHLVYRGAELVVVSKRNGKELEVNAPPDDPRLAEYFGVFRDLQARQFEPMNVITIEGINGRPAQKSEYLEPLRGMFELTADYKSVKLWKRG